MVKTTQLLPVRSIVTIQQALPQMVTKKLVAPLPNDGNPYWILDTEKRLSLLKINLTFPIEDVYSFRVEVSENSKDWKLVGDFVNNQEKISSKEIVLQGITGGIIRVSFEKTENAKLGEIEVTGTVIE